MILLMDMGTRIALYASLAIALNLVVGHSGLLLLCQSVFIGIGAYTSAICFQNQLGFAASSLAAVGVSSFATAVVYLPLLRLRHDAFAVASVAVSLCFVGLLNNLDEYTNGPEGISIERPAIFLQGPSANFELFALALMFLCAIAFIAWWLVRLPFGRTLHAIRSDELGASALGKTPWRFLFRTGTVCGTLSGAVGILFAIYTTHLTPETFSLELSIVVLSAAILGGLGSSIGAVVGASSMVVLTEILRSVFPSLTVAETDRVVFGVFLLIVLRFFPKGLMGDASLR